jgi:cytoskeletal protein CcmA (bactofilin family)
MKDSSNQVKKKLFNTIKSMTNTTSILSKEVVIEGKIKSESNVEIEGKFKGDINGKRVCIREGALVEGFIKSKSLDIEGNFNGEIKTKSINIFKSANIISSNIEYTTLSVEDGASIEGNFKKIDSNKEIDSKEN